MTLQKDNISGHMVVLGGGAVFNERGTSAVNTVGSTTPISTRFSMTLEQRVG